MGPKNNEELKNRINIDQIIKEVCTNEKLQRVILSKEQRHRRYPIYVKPLLKSVKNISNANNKILAEKLNLSPFMISKMKSGASKDTDYVE